VKTAVETIAGTPKQLVATPATAAFAPGIVTAPAVALMVAAGWKVLSGFMAVFVLTSIPNLMNKMPAFSGMTGFFNPDGWSTVAMASMILFKVLPAGFIFFGAYQMLHRRSYAWAVAAAILAILACSLIGLPAGIWALIVLARNEVKNAFGSSAVATETIAAAQKPKSSRRWPIWVGAMLMILVILMVVAVFACWSIANLVNSRVEAKELTSQELQQAGIQQVNGEYRKEMAQSYPLDADGQLKLDDINGHIQIIGWSSNVVAFSAVIHGQSGQGVNGINISVDSEPEQLTVHTEQPNGIKSFSGLWSLFARGKSNDTHVDYVVHVPRQVQGANINNVNGQIQIEGIMGDITAGTVNGEVQITNASGNLKLSTVNGAVKADLKTLGEGETVDLSTVNGGISLTLPENVDATFSASTVNGGISSEFPELVSKRGFPGLSSSLNGSVGQGRGNVKASTVNGAVSILKSPAP
jgi:hypothetical protein